jgi:hypothetical protein
MFTFGLVFDALYMIMLRLVQARSAHRAAAISVMLGLIAKTSVLFVVENRALILPELVGVYIGVVVGIRIGKD